MGLYDTITVWQTCPFCGRFQDFGAQTKDLGRSMFTYRALPGDWFTNKEEREFRANLPVFKQTPFDKEHTVWKSQAERAEALAKIPSECDNLKFVRVIADCRMPNCKAWAEKRDILKQGCISGFGRFFEGKILIQNGFLIGEIYDITVSNSEKKWEAKLKEAQENFKRSAKRLPL